MSPALPALSVSLGLWQDRPSDEVLVTAIAADRLGYGELWIGEMATYDAFVLGAVIGERTERISLTLGPFAVAVRDPVMIAVGAASVAELVGRRVDVAIGSSSPVVVEQWHGRTQRRPAKALAESASALRSLLGGGRASIDGEVIHTNGFRLRTGAPNSELTIAAFGERAVRVAANHADRMVINLVTPASAGRLVSMLREATVDGPAPRVAAWVTAAVDPVPEAFEQLRRGLVPYLGVPGYAEMFREAGFSDIVDLANAGSHPKELLLAVPDELVRAVGLVGSVEEITERLGAYASAGVDEVALVPSSTDGDPGALHTLAALAAVTPSVSAVGTDDRSAELSSTELY